MKTPTTTGSVLIPVIFLSFLFAKCTTAPVTVPPATPEQIIARGKYLVTTSLCHDCHSPKIFNADGSVDIDEARALSGHPAGTKLPFIDTTEITPDKWSLASPHLTAWVGPWGVSYTANLTPDSITGIGAWTEENFIGTMRTGKHLGHEGGRPVLPPMPWYFIGKMTDDDLKSVFAYLKSLKPIVNQVPPPVPPADVAAVNGASL